MADNQSTEASEVLDTAEDTSTNEETQDTEDLDDFELTDEMIESGDADTEESEESEGEPPASGKQEETEEESAEDGGNQPPDAEPQTEDTAVEDARRQAAELAFQQREARRQEMLEQQKRQSQLDYVRKAEDDKDFALRQLQVEAYNNMVRNNNRDLESGVRQAVASIDLFRVDSPVVQEELASALDDFEQLHVRRDRNGDPIEVTGDVYQFLQRKADSIRRLAGVGARQQAVDKTKTTARTVTTPSRTPKQPKVDPDLAAFDEEANRW